VLRSLPSGWRNVPSAPQRISYAAGGEEYAVAYRLPGGTAELSVNGEPLAAQITVYRAAPDAVDLEAGGIRRTYSVSRVTAAGRTSVYVDGPDGSSALTELPRFTDPSAAVSGGSLLAPMPGVVLRVLAEPGEAVTAGQPLIVLEAMKMEQTVAAPADGTITELRAAPGEQVDAGQVLAVVAIADPAGGAAGATEPAGAADPARPAADQAPAADHGPAPAGTAES
jgi:propionyl-CoA carboxylase alpha chain